LMLRSRKSRRKRQELNKTWTFCGHVWTFRAWRISWLLCQRWTTEWTIFSKKLQNKTDMLQTQSRYFSFDQVLVTQVCLSDSIDAVQMYPRRWETCREYWQKQVESCYSLVQMHLAIWKLCRLDFLMGL
jgi:hypothetical protein